MDTLLLDVRYGVRQLFRQRGSSIVAILTLALGMGASTAIFSVADVTLLRPIPYPHPEELVTILVEVDDRDQRYTVTPSMGDVRDWQSADDIFAEVAGLGAAFRGRITDGAAPERIQVRHFTEDYLPMLGVAPVMGRGFTRDDMNPGAPLVALLGYGYWQSRYAGRSNIIGESIRLDDESATVVGVLPAWFNAATPLTTPMRVEPRMINRRGTGTAVEARLRPGLTIEQARERLAARMSSATRLPEDRRDARPVITSRIESSMSQYRTTVLVFAGAVGLILLIAAVNVAGLLLARGSARYSEFAVRASLGAGRLRLIRQLLTESLALAVPATALGVFMTWLSIGAIEKNLPLTLPQNSPIAINGTVLLLTVALLIPTTLLFSIVPALRLTRVQIDAVLARGARQVGSSFSRRGGQVLIAAEIAIAVVLVTGAGLMVRSFLRMSAIELGFTTEGLITMQVLPLERTPAAHDAYYDQLLQRLRTSPSVASAGLVDNLVLGGGTMYSHVTVEGTEIDSTMFEATPGYLETIGARVMQGQLPADAASAAKSVVINESAARKFPAGGVIGREMYRAAEPKGPFVVAAVIRDLRHGGPLDQRGIGQAQMFFPLEASTTDLNAPVMAVVRPAARRPSLGAELRDLAQSIGPRVLVERIRMADEYFGDRTVTPRRRMVWLGLLGGLGLLLALVGVFGMTAYAVTRRTAEIGVRMAFGASPSQVVRTMFKDSALPIAIGTALGIAGSVASARVIRSFLFETEPGDPATLLTVAMALAISGCLAALLPAMRASRVDPATCLRVE